ncbi:MAG: GGDEF domain-containing protein [Desulforhopalus sp.]|jgi:GGDEF domain-containing protein
MDITKASSTFWILCFTLATTYLPLEDSSLTSYEKLIQQVDEALYFAKESGRNQVQPYLTFAEK